jgi:hypothetical protein
MRGVARRATALRSSAQFVIASRIRATTSSVEPNYKFVRQPKNLKALFSQPGVTVIVGKPLRGDRMAWTVNLHNQPTFEADKLKDKIAQRNLPLKLRAVASPVAHRAPNQCLGLNGPRALLARETAQYGSRDVLRHDVKRRRILRVLSNRSHRAPARSPHPSLLRNDTFPRKGGRTVPLSGGLFGRLSNVSQFV